MYLRDYSPYLDSSFPYSKSQNIIRVNLLYNYSTSYYLFIILLTSYLPTYLAYQRVYHGISYKALLYIITTKGLLYNS